MITPKISELKYISYYYRFLRFFSRQFYYGSIHTKKCRILHLAKPHPDHLDGKQWLMLVFERITKIFPQVIALLLLNIGNFQNFKRAPSPSQRM